MYMLTINCIPAVKKTLYFQFLHKLRVHVWNPHTSSHHTWAPAFKCTQQRRLRPTALCNTRYLQCKSHTDIQHGPFTTSTREDLHLKSSSCCNSPFAQDQHSLKDWTSKHTLSCLLPFLHITVQCTPDSSLLGGTARIAHTAARCTLMDVPHSILLSSLKPMYFWVQEQHIPWLQGLSFFGERR